MFREAERQDETAFCNLWQKTFGDTVSFAQTVFSKFAEPENIYVAEEAGTLTAILSAVPVTLQGRKGAYLYGLATDEAHRGQGLMTGLMEYAERQLHSKGVEFLALIPASASLFGFYEARGFQKAFGLRRLTRSIKRNLWAQAEFDTVTAKALSGLRRKFAPDSVQLGDEAVICVLTDLYSAGITIVSSEEGYGLYFLKDNTMEFIELFADGDRAAEKLMEAAREKNGAEQAVVTVGSLQNLFLGEGTQEDYGMIRFLGQKFDVTESYMRLMLDN